MTTQNARFERNLTVLMISKILYSCLFLNSIFILFFLNRGLTSAEFFQAQACMALSIVFFEVPANYLNDRWKYKWGHLIGSFLLVTAHILLALTEGFFFACLFYAVLGVGFCFIRGSFGALLYGTLLILGREKEHSKEFGRISAYSRYTMAFCGASAGFIFVYLPAMPLILQISVQLALLCVTFFIQEPPRSKIEGGGLQLNMLWKAFVQTFKHVDAKWLILIFAILSAASSKAYYVIQPVILDMSLTLNWFGSADMTKVILMGIVSAIASFSIGFASQHSHLVLEKLGAKKLLFMCCSMSFLGYILCGIFHGVWVGLLTLLMVFLSLGLSHVVVQTMMQERIASEIRATVLAMRSMVVSFTFFLVTIGFAWFIESYGFQIALLFTSAVVLIVGMISYKGIRFHKKDVPVISVLS
jgi:hypothetical protein